MSNEVDLTIQWQDHRGYWKVTQGLTNYRPEDHIFNGAIIRAVGPSDNLPWMTEIWVSLNSGFVIETKPEQDWLEDWVPIPNQSQVHHELRHSQLIFPYQGWEISFQIGAGWRGKHTTSGLLTNFRRSHHNIKDEIDEHHQLPH